MELRGLRVPSYGITDMKDKIDMIGGTTTLTPELKDPAFRKKFVNKLMREMSGKLNKSIDDYLEQFSKRKGTGNPVEQLMRALFGRKPEPSKAQIQWVKDNARFLCEEIYESISPNRVVSDAKVVASALLLHKQTHDCGNPDCELDKVLRLFPAQ